MEPHQQQRYRVIDRLASGGMAEVFLAESAGIEGFKKRVAIKRVLPHLSEKKRFIAMFLDEARLSANLSHSNVAQVFDIGVGDNAYFIVMEYVDGADLKAVIEYLRKNGRPFPVEAAVYIALKISEGLTYAHELQSAEGQPLHVVHRDMSPPNVLITKHGEVKIVDFGLAKASSQLEKSEPGIIKGKFSYLSPEAALGGEVDHRADIFAVGIILWEMLAGRRLFLGDSDFATVKQVQNAHVPALATVRTDVPASLERIIKRALARDPDKRYHSARDLSRDLTQFLYEHGRPVGAFDIAELVLGAMKERKRVAPDKASIIDKLIEEALFEFTSLQSTDDGEEAGPKIDDPIHLAGFENIGSWADELSIESKGDEVVRNSFPQGVLEVGNLAALEDPEPGRAPIPPAPREPAPAERVSTPGPERRLSVPPSAQVAPFASARVDSRGAVMPSSVEGSLSDRSPGGAIKAVVVVATLALLAAGAWFGGLIPH